MAVAVPVFDEQLVGVVTTEAAKAADGCVTIVEFVLGQLLASVMVTS